MTRRPFLAAALLAVISAAAEADEPAKKPFVPTSQYDERVIDGWKIHVNRHLLTDQKELGDAALRLLEVKLYDIRRVVPAAACDKLRKVPIWLGVDDGHAPCAEYHPSREWLEANGFNPDKARCVELGNATRFLQWSHEQPYMVLHELAHAYHHQVLGSDHAGIRAAYEEARRGGKYDSVLHYNGRMERHYALSNAEEYFAEGTEAYFGTNDFYPFVRAELKSFDPPLFKLMHEVWGD